MIGRPRPSPSRGADRRNTPVTPGDLSRRSPSRARITSTEVSTSTRHGGSRVTFGIGTADGGTQVWSDAEQKQGAEGRPEQAVPSRGQGRAAGGGAEQVAELDRRRA